MTRRTLFYCTLVLSALSISRPLFAKIQYLFPSNGATAISRTTSIIIRPGDYLNAKTITASLLSVKGAFSGNHAGSFVLSDDKKTLVFTPTFAFTYSERVTDTLK